MTPRTYSHLLLVLLGLTLGAPLALHLALKGIAVMTAYTPTPAQLRLLANLRDGRPIGQGLAQAEVVEHNCLRNGLLRPWPFPGRGRLSEAGRKALESQP